MNDNFLKITQALGDAAHVCGALMALEEKVPNSTLSDVIRRQKSVCDLLKELALLECDGVHEA